MIRDEVLIIGLSSAQIRAGKPLNDEDHDRLLRAVGNVRDAYAKTKQEIIVNTVYKVSGGIKDYLVTPWAIGAFKARSYLRSRGIDAIVIKYKEVHGKWIKGGVR